jgi:hypothetical protein
MCYYIILFLILNQKSLLKNLLKLIRLEATFEILYFTAITYE